MSKDSILSKQADAINTETASLKQDMLELLQEMSNIQVTIMMVELLNEDASKLPQHIRFGLIAGQLVLAQEMARRSKEIASQFEGKEKGGEV